MNLKNTVMQISVGICTRISQEWDYDIVHWGFVCQEESESGEHLKEPEIDKIAV